MQRTIVTAIHAVSLLAFFGLGAALLTWLKPESSIRGVAIGALIGKLGVLVNASLSGAPARYTTLAAGARLAVCAALLDALLSLACTTGLMYLVPAAVGAGLGLVAAFGLGFVLLVVVPTSFTMTFVLGTSR
jgi:hypothetical protein